MDLMQARHFSLADVGEWNKTQCKTGSQQMAANAAFFPLTSISSSFHDYRKAC